MLATAGQAKGPGTKSDMVPWPWGSECPFPWSGVEGAWTVVSLYESQYEGHKLEFAHYTEGTRKALAVSMYSHQGNLVASGRGYSIDEGKVILATMKNISTERRFRIYVRVYPEGQGLSCTDKSKQVMVAAFCSPRGRKCLNESNYILSRPDSK